MTLVNSLNVFGPTTHITPFTIRDGATYLELLEAIRKYVIEVGEQVNANTDAIAAIQDDMENNESNKYAQVFSYAYTSNSVPATGRVYVDSWSMLATSIKISETTDDGAFLSFSLLDSATEAEVRLVTADGKVFRAMITGDSNDNGSYRTIPVSPIAVVGTIPGDTVKTNVAVIVTL